MERKKVQMKAYDPKGYVRVMPSLINLMSMSLPVGHPIDYMGNAIENKQKVIEGSNRNCEIVIPKFACNTNEGELIKGQLLSATFGEYSKNEKTRFAELKQIPLRFIETENPWTDYGNYIYLEKGKGIYPSDENRLKDVAASHCINGKNPLELLLKLEYVSKSGTEEIYIPIPKLNEIFCLDKKHIDNFIEEEIEKFSFRYASNNQYSSMNTKNIPVKIDNRLCSPGEEKRIRTDSSYIWMDIPEKYKSIDDAVSDKNFKL